MKQTLFSAASLIFCFFGTFGVLQAQFTPPRILKHPTQIRTERLNLLNSLHRETNLNVTPDGQYLFFMSGRGQMPWSNYNYTQYKGQPEYDGDIWYSQKMGTSWQTPRCLGNTINTSLGEDEPNISPDGQKVYFQSWRRDWETTNGPYYQATLSGINWGHPVGLGGGITQFFKDMSLLPPAGSLGTDGATLSPDGRTFIVAAGKDYQGNLDLYISRKNAYGQWSYLTRLSVSTLGNERSPFLAGDGKTLYFASDGYGGWGGLDVFKTVLNEDGSHGEIVNIGAPFNTWLDDYGFILTASGDDAFFVREGDIYYAYTKDASPELKPSASTLMLAGKIRDAKTLKGMEAKITVKDANGQVIVEGTSNSLTGEYALIIPVQYINFQQLVSKADYDGFSKSFQITLKPGLNKVVSDVNLNKPAPATLLIAGKVLDEKTLQPLEARIQIKDPATGTVLAEGRSDPQTGAYSLSIPSQNPGFVQEVLKLEYEDFEKSFQIALKPGPNQVNSDVKLRKAGPVEAAAEYGKPDFDLR